MKIKPYIYKPVAVQDKNSRTKRKKFPAWENVSQLRFFLIGILLLLIGGQLLFPQHLKQNSVPVLGVEISSRHTYDAIVQEIRQDPTNPQHYLELARLFIGVNQNRDAATLFDMAEQRGYPVEILAPWRQQLQDRMRRPSELEEKLTAARLRVSEDPLSRDNWMLVAQYAYQLKRLDDARFALERVLSIDPNFDPAKELLDAISSRS